MSTEIRYLGTTRINHFDLPSVINDIEAAFRYRFFVPNEQTSEHVSNLHQMNFPRYVHINWSSQIDIQSIGLDSDTQLVHKENIFFTTDLNNEFAKITTKEQENQEMYTKTRSDASEGSKLDYLLKQSASNSFTEDLENSFTDKKNEFSIPVLDELSQTPIIRTKKIDKDQPPDIYISKLNVSSILKRSDRSPFYINKQWADYQESASLVQNYAEEKEKNNEHTRTLTALYHKLRTIDQDEQVNLLQFQGRTKFTDWKLVGFVLMKYRVEETREIFLTSRFVQSTSYEDPHVSYGKTYMYRLIPVYGKLKSLESRDLVLLGSDESASVVIKCEEKRQPQPPKQINFSYIGDNEIKMNWARPVSEIKDKGIVYDTNDIKGYQIFIRHSLFESYHLYRYYTFNNTVPTSARLHANEIIEDSYIVTSEYDIPADVALKDIPEFFEFKEDTLEIRPNVDYYISMCSIDAHGNSSNYSSQYKIRRDNVTGQVDMKLICSAGAPKQYPNVLIPGKLVNPSFKASGYRKLDIYLAPDSNLAMPNTNGNTAAVNLQLFELETQIEKNISITIKEPDE